MMHLEIITVIIAGVWLLLSFVNYQWDFPILVLLNRWIRWILFGCLFSVIYQRLSDSHQMDSIPLLVSGLLFYALLETIYNWIAIAALSKSGMALFPSFRLNRDRDEWPAHKRYHEIKDWLRSKPFECRQSIKAQLADSLSIRSSVYEEPERKVRLQILFIPQRSGKLSTCYIFSSIASSGRLCITDNVFIPYGGFYPEHWDIERKPMIRSVQRLYKKHLSRMQTYGDTFELWQEDPLEDLNAQQKELERINVKRGFLMPLEEQEEHGKLSGDGRYRIWKEIWMLNYLGISSST